MPGRYLYQAAGNATQRVAGYIGRTSEMTGRAKIEPGVVSRDGRRLDALLSWLVSACALLFAALFAATWVAPERIERSAEGYLVSELQQEMRFKFGATIQHEDARALARRLSGAAARIKEAHVVRPDLVARVVNDSAREGNVAELIPEASTFDGSLAIEQRYRDLSSALLRELRVFTSTNALLFLLSLAAWTFARVRNDLLRFPTLALLASTAVSLSIYFSSQSLLWTLLGSAYVGYGYLLYVVLLFAIFMDVLINEARVVEVLSSLFWFVR